MLVLVACCKSGHWFGFVLGGPSNDLRAVLWLLVLVFSCPRGLLGLVCGGRAAKLSGGPGV